MPPGRKAPGHSNPHPANPSPQSSIATLGKTATPTAGGEACCIGAWRDELQAAAMPPWRKDAVDSCPHPANSNPHPSTTTLGKMAGAAARPQQELAPGRKVAAHPRQELAAAPLTDIEKVRAQNIIENNQVFRSLGISVLSSQLKNTRATVEDEGSQKSGSEYGPQDNEGYEEEEVSKIANISAKGRRGSKRVMPPRQQFEPRVTRQRTTASLSLTTSTEDALVIPRSPIQNEDLNPIGDEDALDETIEQGRRGRSMGKGLDKISRGLSNKICINISEGKRRPEAPIESAKLASESGIIIRNHVPIFPHWKHYKSKENVSQVVSYIGKVAGQFTMDTNNKAVTDACVDLLKCGQRQTRYKLKAKYFNGLSENQVPKNSPVSSMSDEQWLALVNMWSKSEHKEKCSKNKINREKVQFQQRTGSRSYIAQAHVVRQEKFKDSSPTAIDLFKEMHCSKKTGFSEQVKQAIVDMESMIAQPVENGEDQDTCMEAVSRVLPKHSTFLENVGLKISSTSKKARVGVSSQVQDLQFELENERKQSAELREQMEKQSQEIESLKKSTAETNALFRQLISFSKAMLKYFALSYS